MYSLLKSTSACQPARCKLISDLIRIMHEIVFSDQAGNGIPVTTDKEKHA